MFLRSNLSTKKASPPFKAGRTSHNTSIPSSKELSRETLDLSPRQSKSKNTSLTQTSRTPQIGNIKVFCRIRPKTETELQYKDSLNIVDDKTVTLHTSQNNEKGVPSFTFDHVFKMETDQQEIYNTVAKPILENVIEGYNSTIMAYGAASTGKTFTLYGQNFFTNTELRGIVPRLTEQLFEDIQKLSEVSKFLVKLSVIEIQNEKIKDLLKPEKSNLVIREHKYRGLTIEGLSEVPVSQYEETMRQIKIAESHKSSITPSKSHCVMIITVRQTIPQQDNSKISKLFLADLAGAEKVTRGEGGNMPSASRSINRSLQALGNIIYLLADKKPPKHIPYRNSTLTRILKESFGGNSKTSLVLTCSASSLAEHNTLNTLVFGHRARLVRNIPKIKTELTPAQLHKLLDRAEREIEKKGSWIQVLESTLKENKVEIPVDLRQDSSSFLDTKSEIGDTNYPSIIEDLESQGCSEILDRDVSYHSLLNFTQTNDNDEFFNDEEEKEEEEELTDEAQNRISELKEALENEEKKLRIQLQETELLRNEMTEKDRLLKKKENEVNALFLKMEFLKSKIEDVEEQYEKKEKEVERLEELTDKLLHENDPLVRRKIRGRETVSSTRTSLESFEFGKEHLEREEREKKKMNALQVENGMLSKELEMRREENEKLGESYRNLMQDFQEILQSKFVNFEDIAGKIMRASSEQTKASFEREKISLQMALDSRVQKIMELEKELQEEKRKNRLHMEIRSEASTRTPPCNKTTDSGDERKESLSPLDKSRIPKSFPNEFPEVFVGSELETNEFQQNRLKER